MSKFPKISLKAARVNANLTQKSAASQLNINCSTLKNYESGKSVPNWNTVAEIEKLYKYPADFIFFYR